jgi:Leucine-rich repeat (LRR) protein
MTRIEPKPATPKPKLRWYQYSLRTLLVVVFLFALALSPLRSRLDDARTECSAVEALDRVGACVSYTSSEGLASDSRFDSSVQQSTTTRRIDEWLRVRLFGRVVAVHFYDFSGRGQSNRTLTDAFARLEDLRQTQLVELDHTRVTDADLIHLRSLHHLRTLYLWGTKIGDEGIANIANLKELRRLGLQRTLITDAGVERLRRLKNLDTLNLAETRVTDECVKYLVGLKKLTYLDLSYTRVSARGIARLSAELPQTEIIQHR